MSDTEPIKTLEGRAHILRLNIRDLARSADDRREQMLEFEQRLEARKSELIQVEAAIEALRQAAIATGSTAV